MHIVCLFKKNKLSPHAIYTTHNNKITISKKGNVLMILKYLQGEDARIEIDMSIPGIYRKKYNFVSQYI